MRVFNTKKFALMVLVWLVLLNAQVSCAWLGGGEGTPPITGAPVETMAVGTITPTAVETPTPTAGEAQPGNRSTPAVRETQAQVLQVTRNVVFGEVDGFKLAADIYSYAPVPAGEVRPAVLILHGGGWEGGTKEDMRTAGEILAEQGFVVFAVNYRLTTWPGARFPAQLVDVQRAMRWVRANAATYQIDPQRVAAMGFSAGGHLAAFLGVTDTWDDSIPELSGLSSRAACVVDVFGPTDLTADLPEDASGDYITRVVTNLIGHDRDQAPDLYRQASPIFFIDEQTVPFLIFHGSADPVVPVDQSRRFYQALQAAGVEVEYIEFEGEGHRFERPANQARFVTETVNFLDRCLNPGR